MTAYCRRLAAWERRKCRAQWAGTGVSSEQPCYGRYWLHFRAQPLHLSLTGGGGDPQPVHQPFVTEELPNHTIFASDVYCALLFASPSDGVSGLPGTVPLPLRFLAQPLHFGAPQPSASTIVTEALPNHCIFASDVYCILLFASPFDSVSGLPSTVPSSLRFSAQSLHFGAQPFSSTIVTEALSNHCIVASDVYLFASLCDGVSDLPGTVPLSLHLSA